MRYFSLLTIILFIFFCGQCVAAPVKNGRDVDAVALLERDSKNATTTATGISTQTRVTTTASATEKSSSDASKTTVAPSVPSLDNGSSSQSVLNQTTTYSNGLPIQPKITPALGVGGVILMAVGLVLTFIGIRKPRIHIFLSTGLLAALGVTLLIIYVMSPPVSDGVQGGYLVAIFFTGVIFGGVAILFRDLTEGLCCLLGGFCIGMWLMTLKSGGLVTSSGPKAAFIIVFAVAFFCLTFSHYTRSYGSIVCTAFAGATSLVLGIDCFSRAGLKEFWLYIWALNNDVFPLNTNTYPITRSIRVELAVTVVVAVLGVIAQLRLWRVIRERKIKEEAANKEEERRKEEAVSEITRQVEEKNSRDRAEWESIYGNGSAGDKEPSLSETAVTESRRDSGSEALIASHEKEITVEMNDMASPRQSAIVSESGNNTLYTVEESTAEDDETPKQQTEGKLKDASECNDLEAARPITPAPLIVVPVTDPNIHDENESEHGAVVGSEIGSPHSKRFSNRSIMNRVSWRSSNGISMRRDQSEEALITRVDSNSSVQGFVDDIQSMSSRRSSISDTNSNTDNQIETPETEKYKLFPDSKSVAEETELGLESFEELATGTNPTNHGKVHDDPSSMTQSDSGGSYEAKPVGRAIVQDVSKDRPQTDELDTSAAQVEVKSSDSQLQESQPEMAVLETADNNTESHIPEEMVVSDADAATDGKVLESPQSNANQNEESSNKVPRSEADTEPEAEPVKKEKPKLDKTTVQSISEQTSRIVHSFRTREWAKHLADADAPTVEPLQLMKKAVKEIEEEEAPAPVNMDSLLQTPLNALPPPVLNNPHPAEAKRHKSTRRRSRSSSMEQNEPSRSSSRMGSKKSPVPSRSPPILPRNFSSNSLVSQVHENSTSKPRRSTSSALMDSSSPVDGRKTPESHWKSPTPLMAVREDMIRNRISSTSLRHDPWAASSRSQSRQSSANQSRNNLTSVLSIPDERDEEAVLAYSDADADDVPLSKRRAMLQQKGRKVSSESYPSVESSRSHKSAKPERSVAVMAAWRQSVRQDILQQDSLAFTSPVIPERPHAQHRSAKKAREASASYIDSAIAEGMQRGSMTDLHRKTLRKMQASTKQT